jgi:hypothetical protein
VDPLVPAPVTPTLPASTNQTIVIEQFNTPVVPPTPTLVRTTQATSVIPKVLVNHRRIRLNYSISQAGPSGIAAVELWATRDGKNWTRYSNEPPPNGPLVVHVTEEGRYGFSVVVRNGAGLSSPQPQRGDAPQIWVDVDETAPRVKLTDVVLGQGSEVGTLGIYWTAADQYLRQRPVTISMAKDVNGPWTQVVTNVENTGKYIWQMPKDMPYKFYVRVEATDRAGNVGSDKTYTPIKIDLIPPRGTIVGVNHDWTTEPGYDQFLYYMGYGWFD